MNRESGIGNREDDPHTEFTGSASEIETELLIARRLNYLDEDDFMILSTDLDDIGRMITGMSRSLKRQEV